MAFHHHHHLHNQGSEGSRRSSYLNPKAQEYHPFIHSFSSSSSTTSIISSTNNTNNHCYYYHNYHHPTNSFPFYHSPPLLPSIYQKYPSNNLSLMQQPAQGLGLGLGQSSAAPTTARLSPGPTSCRSRDGSRGRRRRRRWGSGSNCYNGRKQGYKGKTNNDDEWRCSKGSSSRRSSSCGQNIMPVKVVKPNGIETTAMIRNIPNQYTRQMLIKFLDHFCRIQNQKLDLNHHQPLAFDFLYLPMDFMRDANKGYAFVNFTHPNALWKLYLAFNDRRWEHCKSTKICEISCATIQGKESLLKHFGTSTFRCNHEDYLPVCFSPPRDGSGASVAETSIGRRIPLSRLSITYLKN